MYTVRITAPITRIHHIMQITPLTVYTLLREPCNEVPPGVLIRRAVQVNIVCVDVDQADEHIRDNCEEQESSKFVSSIHFLPVAKSLPNQLLNHM